MNNLITPPVQEVESSEFPNIPSNLFIKCNDVRLFFNPPLRHIDLRILESNINFVDQKLISLGIGRIANITKRNRENQIGVGPSP